MANSDIWGSWYSRLTFIRPPIIRPLRGLDSKSDIQIFNCYLSKDFTNNTNNYTIHSCLGIMRVHLYHPGPLLALGPCSVLRGKKGRFLSFFIFLIHILYFQGCIGQLRCCRACINNFRIFCFFLFLTRSTELFTYLTTLRSHWGRLNESQLYRVMESVVGR